MFSLMLDVNIEVIMSANLEAVAWVLAAIDYRYKVMILTLLSRYTNAVGTWSDSTLNLLLELKENVTIMCLDGLMWFWILYSRLIRSYWISLPLKK